MAGWAKLWGDKEASRGVTARALSFIMWEKEKGDLINFVNEVQILWAEDMGTVLKV